MEKREDVKNCWMIAIVTLLAIMGLIVGLVYFNGRISSLETDNANLKEQIKLTDALVKERLKTLDTLVEEKVKHLNEVRENEDQHNREILEIKTSSTCRSSLVGALE